MEFKCDKIGGFNPRVFVFAPSNQMTLTDRHVDKCLYVDVTKICDYLSF